MTPSWYVCKWVCPVCNVQSNFLLGLLTTLQPKGPWSRRERLWYLLSSSTVLRIIYILAVMPVRCNGENISPFIVVRSGRIIIEIVVFQHCRCPYLDALISCLPLFSSLEPHCDMLDLTFLDRLVVLKWSIGLHRATIGPDTIGPVKCEPAQLPRPMVQHQNRIRNMWCFLVRFSRGTQCFSPWFSPIPVRRLLPAFSSVIMS
jgi:hypothetical protein